MYTTKRRIASYVLLPGLLPRLGRLLAPGNGFLAYWIASIYNSVKILPVNHAYLNPANRGKFGVRHVVAEAAGHITWNVRHADQIIVFFTVLAGLVMFALQFTVLALSLLSVPAFALTNYAGVYIPTSPFEIFVTPNPAQDIAFIMLDLVFGIPDMFNSCIAEGVSCLDNKGRPLPYTAVGAFPTPFQTALHEVLAFYSYGLFLVGVVIILYFVISTVGETAASGTPFGRRFNRLWAPIRLMFFFFLIVPIVYNLNIAQMATLHAARIGSSMATNLWLTFNRGLELGENNSIIGSNLSWLAEPKIPEVGGLQQFLQTAAACKYAERIQHNRYIQAYIVKQPVPGETAARYFSKYPANDLVTSPEPGTETVTDLSEALEFVGDGDIPIRFGEYNPVLYPNEKGHVYPWCGEIVIHNPGVTSEEAGTAYTSPEGMGNFKFPMINYFTAVYVMMQEFWTENMGSEGIHVWGSNIARNVLLNEENPLPSTTTIKTQITDFQDALRLNLRNGFALYFTYANTQIPQVILDKGWAGAAIWYNKVAEMNGGFTTAVQNIPQPSKWPDAQEQIMEQRRANDQDASGADRFNPVLGDNRMVEFVRPEDADTARTERYAFMLWQTEATTIQARGTGGVENEFRVSNNPLIDAINSIFGTSGLFDMRQQTSTSFDGSTSMSPHPLAQLSSVGKGLIDSAVRAFGFSVGVSLGGLLGLFSTAPASIGGAMASIALTIATIGLAIGFMLYYIVPFMPFVYFLFAVGGWVKAIFEAILGVPLWALAHIRIDGEGLPGPGGMNGYFMIFEILLRPSLIIFGLVASVSIMAALVQVLNDIFDIVVVNLTGHESQVTAKGGEAYRILEPPAGYSELEFFRNAIDQFFYTIVYAILVYMISISCFKLIDLVPDYIMRWLGTNVNGFAEEEKDSAGKLLKMGYEGSLLARAEAGRGATSSLQRSVLLSHFVGGSG